MSAADYQTMDFEATDWSDTLIGVKGQILIDSVHSTSACADLIATYQTVINNWIDSFL